MQISDEEWLEYIYESLFLDKDTKCAIVSVRMTGKMDEQLTTLAKKYKINKASMIRFAICILLRGSFEQLILKTRNALAIDFEDGLKPFYDGLTLRDLKEYDYEGNRLRLKNMEEVIVYGEEEDEAGLDATLRGGRAVRLESIGRKSFKKGKR